MANSKLKCIICGKEYEGCRTPDGSGVFRWQSVACSPECGDEYIKYLISAANSNKNKAEIEVEESKNSERLESTNSVESGESQPVSLFETDDEYGFSDDPDEDYDNSFVSGE